jgi:Arc/MetJ family transcription regulator
MRTNIDIPDDLIAEAQQALGVDTKRAAVLQALERVIVQHRRERAIRETAGIGWGGDLDAMRDADIGPP